MIRRWRAFLVGQAQAMALPAIPCTSGGCVAAGPRLASVDANRGALLNLLFGRLLNGSANAAVADWQALATGSVGVGRLVDALGVAASTTSPLDAQVSVATVLQAAAQAAFADQKSALGLSLQNAASSIGLLSGTVRLGDLLVTDGALGTTQINALELVSGVVQLFNTKNVVSTPAAITVPGLDLGLGGTIAQLTLAAQVVEPPVYACGPTGTTFHTATVRLRLGIDLVSLSLDTGLLAAIPLVNTVSLRLVRLDVYLEVARAEGTLGLVDAIAGAMSVQARPGVADLYLGLIPDATFFNRTRALSAADVTPAPIAALTINGSTVAVRAKASARGQAPSATLLNFTGPYPQTRTAYTQAGFAANLLGSLVGNLTLSLSPSLPLNLDVVVLTTLKGVVAVALVPLLSDVLAVLADPLLETLGVRLGEVDVTAGGTKRACALAGCVYDDANHSGGRDAGEAGTGQTLYAKLVDPARPAGPAAAVAAVDAATCTFSFPAVDATTWQLVVNDSANPAAVTPSVPAGWLATHHPALSTTVTVRGDTAGPRLGLFHGSRVSGQVADDSGTGQGTAHNGVRDGAEAGLAGLAVRAMAGNTVLDTAVTGDAGAYTLWLPASAAAVAVSPTLGGSWVAVGGRAGTTGGGYALATNTLTFTPSAGASTTGADFTAVPASRLDTDGQQTAGPGQAVFLPHTFTAGTAGQLSVSATAAAGGPGWGPTLLHDTACDGRPDATDVPITGSIGVTAGQRVCVLVKLAVPATAGAGTRQALDVLAQLALSQHTLVLDHRRRDVVTVGGSDSGLRLTKSVDRASASSGQLLVYTITYLNQGPGPVTALEIHDGTPAYTTLEAAECGVDTPPGMACSVAALPAVAGRGAVRWAFTGALPSGASGSVRLRVRVD